MSSHVVFYFLLAIATLTQAQTGVRATTPSASRNFRWSEFSSHELGYDHILKKASDIAPIDKLKLASAILRQLKGDRTLDDDLKDLTKAQLHELVENTRIELVDLNGDGRPEYIAQANGLGPCGGTGNCLFWIFRSTPTGVKVLLVSSRFEKIAIRSSTTGGYKDIVLGSHVSASERNLVWYKFRDGRYRKHACYYMRSMSSNMTLLSSPDIDQVPCTQLFGKN
jgi:hypothetical protein